MNIRPPQYYTHEDNMPEVSPSQGVGGEFSPTHTIQGHELAYAKGPVRFYQAFEALVLAANEVSLTFDQHVAINRLGRLIGAPGYKEREIRGGVFE